jgi:diguanylate cyclase (GGDEF)-like protein
MSTHTTASPRARGAVLPLVVAVLSLLAVIAWLLWRGGDSARPGYLGGPVSLAAAAVGCRRIGSTIAMSGPLRAFWRRFSNATVWFVGATVALATFPAHEQGVSPCVAAPIVLGVATTMHAFTHLPLGRRTRLDWGRLLLDGTTVAVAGTLIFWYVLVDLAPAGTSTVTQIGVGLVGVGGLLAVVVIGKAALTPWGPVDPVALRFLTVAPLTGVVAAVLFVVEPELRLALCVVSPPFVAVSLCLAAHRQLDALRRPPPPPAAPGRSLFNLLPFLAVTATAGLVVSVSARQMTGHQRAVIIGAVLIAGCVVLRQLLGMRENVRLLDGIRRQQAQLERLAFQDTLTGLANRARFGVALTERLDAHRPASVLLIDIDDFTTINDTMGEAVGDQILVAVAQRLREQCGVSGLPARLSGDEFAVLLDVDDAERAEEAAARMLAALAVPFEIGEYQLLTHVSIGVALTTPGDGAEDVLRNADMAMHAAKATGKASWTRFEPRMRADVVNHARLGSELHSAIVRGELFLLYQPVYDIESGRMSAAEALVRWQHPERGLIPPGDFIPVAERSGLIVPLGAWVLRTACHQLAAWRGELGDAAIDAINVNVAARQLRDPHFVDEVAAVLAETGLRPRNLIVEVTESSVLDGREVRETLEALHELGVQLALDDFGTGQSSLSLLREFRVDVLKLDKSFVDGICDNLDRGRLAVAAAVVQLAEHLELKAVAEGIESDEQRCKLRDMGYRYGQGFRLARPLPAAQVSELLAAARAFTTV